jgi:hypothetical protein
MLVATVGDAETLLPKSLIQISQNIAGWTFIIRLLPVGSDISKLDRASLKRGSLREEIS